MAAWARLGIFVALIFGALGGAASELSALLGRAASSLRVAQREAVAAHALAATAQVQGALAELSRAARLLAADATLAADVRLLAVGEPGPRGGRLAASRVAAAQARLAQRLAQAGDGGRGLGLALLAADGRLLVASGGRTPGTAGRV